MKRFLTVVLSLLVTGVASAQNPLFIPPTLNGPTFNLNVQMGTKEFVPGFTTPTYGVNGDLLGPTLFMNKGDLVTLNVTNNINSSTTMHWHGLHVPPEDDGGPHQSIAIGDTWSPQFEMMNDAATFWYHPHGEGKTDMQVAKGIAGFIIVKDSVEAALPLPRTYGVDDVPLVIQTKAFDELYQIAIATVLDTLIVVNGTVDPFVELPAQVVRLRLLDGSSMRSYYLGLSNNDTFYQIGTDGGLLEQPVALTRLLLAPGERAEVLLDLTSMQGQTVYLKSYASEMPNGIYGASQVGSGMSQIPDYATNPLNGADFDLLQINVAAPTANAITSMPSSLVTLNPWDISQVNVNRTLTLAPETMGMEDMVMGPFSINGAVFDMEVVNVTTYLNNVEKWTFTNNTLIAHSMHIHDIQFFLLDINGAPVPENQQGKKDVVLVMPQQSVSLITKFEDFANNDVPYMYHCHMLHHEDDGMMGSFLVLDTTTSINNVAPTANLKLYPNPSDSKLFLELSNVSGGVQWFIVRDAQGKLVTRFPSTKSSVQQFDVSDLPNGLYVLQPGACYQSFEPVRFVINR